MALGWIINGPCQVSVRGNDNTAKILGLTTEEIRVIPRWVHQDMKTNDFGPELPPDVQFQLAEVSIRMALIDFDLDVLKYCYNQAMAGSVDGTLVGAGTPMGGGWPVYNANCHYMRLLLSSPDLGLPWRFLASYIVSPEFPIGTTATVAPLVWRAIPYREGTVSQGAQVLTIPADIQSAGVVLWDRNDLSV